MGNLDFLHRDAGTPNRDSMFVVTGTITAPGASNHAAVEIHTTTAGNGPLYVVAMEADGDVALELEATSSLTTPVAPTDTKAFGGSAALNATDARQGHITSAPAASDQVFATADGRVDMPIPLRVQGTDWMTFTHTTANTALVYSVWLFRGGGV